MKEITKWNYEYINNKELQDYLNYIKQFEVLKKEEQINLFNKYQKGDKNAFKKLINHNLGLSVTIPREVFPASIILFTSLIFSLPFLS